MGGNLMTDTIILAPNGKWTEKDIKLSPEAQKELREISQKICDGCPFYKDCYDRKGYKLQECKIRV